MPLYGFRNTDAPHPLSYAGCGANRLKTPACRWRHSVTPTRWSLKTSTGAAWWLFLAATPWLPMPAPRGCAKSNGIRRLERNCSCRQSLSREPNKHSESTTAHLVLQCGWPPVVHLLSKMALASPQNRGLMNNHALLTDRGMTGPKVMGFPPGTITWFHRISLSLVRIAALFLIPLASAAAQGVCDRTPQVRDRLVQTIGVSSCAEVTTKHLADVTGLSLWVSGVSMLQEGDFDGLSSLEELNLMGNALTTLPRKVFRGLDSVQRIYLAQNQLSSLPEGVFQGLSSLQYLHLAQNPLSSLPQTIFHGLSSLQHLRLEENNLSSLSETIFHGLSSLERLELSYNNLSSLPARRVRFRGRLSGAQLPATPKSSLQLPELIAGGSVPRTGLAARNLLVRKSAQQPAR